VTLYTAVVNSVALKRTIRLVYVCKRHETKLLTAVLFSTDTDVAAEDIYRYYTARFQIEFLFRDAKQFTGLSDFQTRSEARIAFHVNASMTALNFLKLESLPAAHAEHVISINSGKSGNSMPISLTELFQR
jgi:IS4 transposase